MSRKVSLSSKFPHHAVSPLSPQQIHEQQALQKIVDKLSEIRKKISSNTGSEKREDFLNLKSVQLEFLEERNLIKKTINEFIENEQLEDNIYMHSDKCIRLISCFEKLRIGNSNNEEGEENNDSEIMNSFIAIFEKSYNNLNSESASKWKNNVISIGHFLFGEFTELSPNKYILWLQKYLCLPSIYEESHMPAFFYFHTNAVWV